MNTQMQIPTPLESDTDYVVTNQTGWLVGAVFRNGTLGPLSLFRPNRKTCQLELMRPISDQEATSLAQHPLMSWYVLTQSGGMTIALLYCRYDPFHQVSAISLVQGTGHVGV